MKCNERLKIIEATNYFSPNKEIKVQKAPLITTNQAQKRNPLFAYKLWLQTVFESYQMDVILTSSAAPSFAVSNHRRNPTAFSSEVRFSSSFSSILCLQMQVQRD